MRIYRFQVSQGQSKPFRTIQAEHNEDFYEKLAKLEKDEGVTLFGDSIICTISEIMRVPPPLEKKRFVPVDTLSNAEAAL